MNDQLGNIRTFESNVTGITSKIDGQINQLLENSNRPDLFAEIAGDMDSLYEMAKLVKYKEFARYAKIIKEICVICPLADNHLAYKKGINMISTFLDSKDILFKGLSEPSILPLATSKVKHAHQKMEIFQRTFVAPVAD